MDDKKFMEQIEGGDYDAVENEKIDMQENYNYSRATIKLSRLRMSSLEESLPELSNLHNPIIVDMSDRGYH